MCVLKYVCFILKNVCLEINKTKTNKKNDRPTDLGTVAARAVGRSVGRFFCGIRSMDRCVVSSASLFQAVTSNGTSELSTSPKGRWGLKCGGYSFRETTDLPWKREVEES